MKEETIKEYAKSFSKKYYSLTICSDGLYKSFEEGFISGAKWQSERMYNKEDLREAFEHGIGSGKYQQEYGINAIGSMTFENLLNILKTNDDKTSDQRTKTLQ